MVQCSSVSRAFLVTYLGRGSSSHDLEDSFTTHLRTSSTVTILNLSNVQKQTRLTPRVEWTGTTASRSIRILVILSEKNSANLFASFDGELHGG